MQDAFGATGTSSLLKLRVTDIDVATRKDCLPPADCDGAFAENGAEDPDQSGRQRDDGFLFANTYNETICSKRRLIGVCNPSRSQTTLEAAIASFGVQCAARRNNFAERQRMPQGFGFT